MKVYAAILGVGLLGLVAPQDLFGACILFGTAGLTVEALFLAYKRLILKPKESKP